MDHIGVEARREGAKLIIKQVLEMCGKEPAIVTGDFNVDQNNEAYHTMLQGGVMKDSYEAAAEKFATNGTFNSFNADLHTESRIDHIFVTAMTAMPRRVMVGYVVAPLSATRLSGLVSTYLVCRRLSTISWRICWQVCPTTTMKE
jgi:endonuclease/exonuclease/phosphatase family metal-dependent hydrolase